MARILVYRSAVLFLTVFYLIYTVLAGDWLSFGGPWRYLTVWALTFSSFVALHVFRKALGHQVRSLDGLIAATAVINAMVVMLYWRLYFADPFSVTPDGQLGVWWREYYMHAVGPLLMWIDAVFINRVFRRIWDGLVVLIFVFIAYVIWIEFFVQRFNDLPSGGVTNGLPYRFLNSMVFGDRIGFYVTNLAVGIVFLSLFSGLAFTWRCFAQRRH